MDNQIDVYVQRLKGDVTPNQLKTNIKKQKSGRTDMTDNRVGIQTGKIQARKRNTNEYIIT